MAFLDYLFSIGALGREEYRVYCHAQNFIIKELLDNIAAVDKRSLCYHWREYIKGGVYGTNQESNTDNYPGV